MKKALAICLIAIVGAGTVVGIWALVDFAGKAQVPSVIAGR